MTTSAIPVPVADVYVTDAVRDAARNLAQQNRLPAYVYDVAHLRSHLVAIKAALSRPASAGSGVEILYAVKANPDAEVVRTAAEILDGLEVSSGGEIAHVRALLPDARLIFGGPGKTDAELSTALTAGVHRFHVESVDELRRLNALAADAGVIAEILFRVNIQAGITSGNNNAAALTMGGVPSPFGMDPEEAALAAAQLEAMPNIKLHGVHAHLASGVDSATGAAEAEDIARWARSFAAEHGLELSELNVGGGMSVDYLRTAELFDWTDYASRLNALAEKYPEFVFQIEPGRALSAYSGWYLSRVQELKRSHGKWFAVCSGGTHHLRTPAAKGHSQPLSVLQVAEWDRPWNRASLQEEPVSFVGQLCTPKDLLARDVPVSQISTGDTVIFGLAGAYALNISHRDFLMHPQPEILHVGAPA